MAEKEKKEVAPWLGRYRVISEDHYPDLESRSAIHEFHSKLPREEAEAQAHRDYLEDQAFRAAAHHLLGIRAAVASGHDAAAKRHGQAYAAAMKAAGHNPIGEPPQKVLDYLKDLKHTVYSFKSHEADGLFEPQEEPKADESDSSLRQKLDALKSLKKRLE